MYKYVKYAQNYRSNYINYRYQIYLNLAISIPTRHKFGLTYEIRLKFKLIWRLNVKYLSNKYNISKCQVRTKFVDLMSNMYKLKCQTWTKFVN